MWEAQTKQLLIWYSFVSYTIIFIFFVIFYLFCSIVNHCVSEFQFYIYCAICFRMIYYYMMFFWDMFLVIQRRPSEAPVHSRRLSLSLSLSMPSSSPPFAEDRDTVPES